MTKTNKDLLNIFVLNISKSKASSEFTEEMINYVLNDENTKTLIEEELRNKNIIKAFDIFHNEIIKLDPENKEEANDPSFLNYTALSFSTMLVKYNFADYDVMSFLEQKLNYSDTKELLSILLKFTIIAKDFAFVNNIIEFIGTQENSNYRDFIKDDDLVEDIIDRDNTKTIASLINNGFIDKNYQDSAGNTLLHMAV